MFFILQKDEDYNDLDVDLITLKQELNKQRFQHQYTHLSIRELDKPLNKINMKDVIPVGSLDFVGKYLKTFHGVENMNPIEVPNELRVDDFLCRKYSIVDSTKLPKTGYHFLKDASCLKQFSYMGDLTYFFYDEIFDEPKRNDMRLHLNKDHLFVVSEVKQILSEYRVFVDDDNIKGIQFYDGDPLIMPTPDEIKKIRQMVSKYMLNKSRPGAYSLDVAIIKTPNFERDLMILECHPFCCLGLYGISGSFLPYAYRRGLDWYIDHNTPVQNFSNY